MTARKKAQSPSRHAKDEQPGKFEQAAKEFQEALRPYTEGYQALLLRLTSEGFRIDDYTIMAPIQLAGILPSGEAFYLRCRHSTCSLSVSSPGGNPVKEPVWKKAITRWEWPDAGCLEAEEAEAVLRELLASHASRRV